MTTFLLGTHRPHWLGLTSVPLFVSRVTLAGYRRLPQARGPWALDSGAFTEVGEKGGWTIGPDEYAAFVRRCADEVGNLIWASPQDWMCEPDVIAATGLSVAEHQRRTVRSFLDLSERDLPTPVIPVLQGWTLDDYLRCIDLYGRADIDLTAEPLVGLGTVCRRQGTREAAAIARRLAGDGLRLHGFGVKKSGLDHPRWAYWDALASCDSMAWSAAARWDANHGIPSCDPARRRSCTNCLHYALDYRERLLASLRPVLWKEAPSP